MLYNCNKKMWCSLDFRKNIMYNKKVLLLGRAILMAERGKPDELANTSVNSC